jgi:hypothetical protein
MKKLMFAEFARIPGACSISIDVTAEEYDAFEAKAKVAGKSVKDFAKGLLLK